LPIINFLDKPESEITQEELSAMIRYINWREHQLNWADIIVRHLNLKLPSGQRIRTWYEQEWGHMHSNIRGNFYKCRDAVQAANIFPDPEEDLEEELGPHWLRPQEYVGAALALTCTSADEMQIKIDEIVELKDFLFDDHEEEVYREPLVQGSAKKFMAKVGRKLRDMSPAKSKRRRTMTTPPRSPQTPDLSSSQRRSKDFGSPSKLKRRGGNTTG
jgi:hypothetical protein